MGGGCLDLDGLMRGAQQCETVTFSKRAAEYYRSVAELAQIGLGYHINVGIFAVWMINIFDKESKT